VEGISEYIRIQGFSSDMSTRQENIMLGYAFSGNSYSFLEIVEDPMSKKPETGK
jgi:hypothetical protein